MRLTVRLLVPLALVAATFSAGPARAETPVFAKNVELLGTIPDLGAVSGDVREIGGRRYFLMTSLQGVSAYDVTMPELPLLVGHLPLPNVENEDVEMSGDILLVASDPGFSSSRLGGLYVIDIAQLPLITFKYVNPATGNRFRTTDVYTTPPPYATDYLGGHTVSCIPSGGNDCAYAWAMGPGGGSDRIYVIDLRDAAHPQLKQVYASPVGGTHDIDVDAAGLGWLVGDDGFAAVDLSDPEQLRVISRHDPAGLDYNHNSYRPDAERYVSRAPGDTDPAMRPGEELLITEEDWLDPQCSSQGRFATASIVNFDKPAAGSIEAPSSVRVLDRWTTELGAQADRSPGKLAGTFTDGNHVATITCSAHWFTERNDVVAISWYEQGTRFLDVSDPSDIRQVGYIVMPNTSSFATYWITDDIAYTLDGTRGIDILRFTGGTTSRTVRAPVLPEWFGPAGAVPSAPDPAWGSACRIATGLA